MLNRPSVFIGSSSESLAIAKALQILLNSSCEVTIWNQGVFGLNEYTLESLIKSIEKSDFAILIFSTDDITTSREITSSSPRDNVIFELGLFIGSIGLSRTFIVYDKTSEIKIPTDIAGITLAPYTPHSTNNLTSALGPAATQIEEKINNLGRRENKNHHLLSSLPKKSPSKIDLRELVTIAIIDDNPFQYSTALKNNGFNLEEIGDINDYNIAIPYDIIICDIQGVGSAFGSRHGGAYVIQGLRERFPDKYLIIFSGGQYDLTYKKYYDKCDKSIKKDADIEDWIVILDEAAEQLGNLKKRWIRIRSILMDTELDMNQIMLLENYYTEAILNKNPKIISSAFNSIAEKSQLAKNSNLDGISNSLEAFITNLFSKTQK